MSSSGVSLNLVSAPDLTACVLLPDPPKHPELSLVPLHAQRSRGSLPSSESRSVLQLSKPPDVGDIPLSLEGVSQMVYILPERVPALVRPAFGLVL